MEEIVVTSRNQGSEGENLALASAPALRLGLINETADPPLAENGIV